ncbi:MAG: transcription antitermination factor NusB [Lachnospiraceae bacterium]|nr:transcription antitermination factor NusB [Lachnospiraceae bacterium]
MSVSRIRQRDLTMKMVYQYSFYPNPELDTQIGNFLELQDNLEEEDRALLLSRAQDIFIKIPSIDEQIGSYSKDWDISRMNKADLSILRLAVYEILYDPGVETSLAINEAVNLAKQYGGEDSPRFVNGILARFA